MAEKQSLLPGEAGATGSLNAPYGTEPMGMERTVEVNNERVAAQPWWKFGMGGRRAPAHDVRPKPKLRKVPVKVEPKVFFANERTFIAWMHMAVTLSTITIAVLAFADQNEWSEIYGLVMLPCSIFFVIYAISQYLSRAAKIRARSPGPYESVWGPVFLAGLLAISILVNFAIKMYEMTY